MKALGGPIGIKLLYFRDYFLEDPLFFVGGIPLGVNRITFGFLPSAWVGDCLLKVKSFEWIVIRHVAHKGQIIGRIPKFEKD